MNTDVWDDGSTTRPDVVVKQGEPYPFADDEFDAVFLGHVLEHIPWREVPIFLDEMKRVAKPGAKFLVCGPDVFKTIKRWASGQEPWHMVLSVMEHLDATEQGQENVAWEGAHHHWNCHHERVWNLLGISGFVGLRDVCDEIPKNPSGSGWNDGEISWPVVGHWHWHFAIACNSGK